MSQKAEKPFMVLVSTFISVRLDSDMYGSLTGSEAAKRNFLEKRGGTRCQRRNFVGVILSHMYSCSSLEHIIILLSTSNSGDLRASVVTHCVGEHCGEMMHVLHGQTSYCLMWEICKALTIGCCADTEITTRQSGGAGCCAVMENSADDHDRLWFHIQRVVSRGEETHDQNANKNINKM